MRHHEAFSHDLRVMLVAGSAEYPSRVRAILDALTSILQNNHVEADIWDLYQRPLPLLGSCGENETDAMRNRNIEAFRLGAARADAFVLATPIYHNSYSGILKNALDCLTTHHFQRKPVALVCSGSNERTASLPCEHLSSVVRCLHAIPTPTQIITLPAEFSLGQRGYRLVEAVGVSRLAVCAEELIAYARLLRGDRIPLPDVPSIP